MKLRDVMTKEVTSLNVDDTVEKAAQIMKEKKVGSIPVCRDGKIEGMVTDRDITLRSIAQGENISSIKVSSIMSLNPITGDLNMDVHEAANLMAENQIRRLPVVDNNAVVGILSLGDLAVEPKFVNEAGDALSEISENTTSTT
ncbi:CBS domain-containing protein [Clostridium estertheticum]|uniref:CBS domain-containing protein n=1 Tax=Clostridium estertheticum TaxID=238834 RepID=UPI0013E902BF|nr:CBS domain-containing protein [Clostridium estertheticum]MBZ9688291.1 CBS domain-containing protein [Clostridium estertheticum]